MFGPMFGPVLSGISSIAGLFKKPATQKWVTPNYSEIRQKAEEAGFNPITALTSAPGQLGVAQNVSFGQRVSDAAAGLADAFQQKNQLDLQKTELDQRERELELKAKAVRKLQETPPARSAIVARQSAVIGTRVARSSAPQPDYVSERPTPVLEVYKTPGGDVPVPVGPDLDEVVSGAAIMGVGKLKSAVANATDWANRMESGQLEYLKADKVKPKKTDGSPELPAGVTPPKDWSFWNDFRKAQYMVRFGYLTPTQAKKWKLK